jgi:hypothetical protein
MSRAPKIIRVNVTTSMPMDLRVKLVAFAKAKKMAMATVIEEGVKMRMADGALPADVEADLRDYMAELEVDRATVLELALRRFFKAESNG